MVERLLGENMVMGLAEEEEVRPVSFYWYAEEDDFDEEGNLNLTISAGRLRHKWVPTRKTSAMLFVREHENGAGLRARNKPLQLVRIFSFDVEDITEKYPQAVVEGLHGIVVKTPITVSIPRGRRGLTSPPFYTAGDKDIYSPISTSEVGSIQSGILSDEDILNMSVVEVTSPVAFQDDAENTAAVGGVYDRRMGSIEKTEPCETCDKVRLEIDASNSCPGHFGHISLEVPIPKILYMGVEKRIGKPGYPLLFTLNHVCHTCYRVPLPDEILKPKMALLEQQFELGKKNYRGYENIKTILRQGFDQWWKGGERKECPHCDAYTPKFEFVHTPKPEFFVRKGNADLRYQDGARNFDFGYVRNILANIPDSEARILGFDPPHSRPENMFYGVMPVAPNPIRPKRMVPGKALDIDDLSKLYQDVVYANNSLRTAQLRGYGESSVIKATTRLYIAVSRVTDNQIQSIGSGGTSMERGFQGGERKVSYKGLMNRLSGKGGRFRTNLQSKYVEDVGYSTVTPNGDLAIDEVGVPIDMCKKTAIEEKVDASNIERLREAIINGPDVYPGALDICLDGNTYNQDYDNWVELEGGDNRKISRERYANNLEYGCVVKRHVIRNDIGLFNRAPSLHRQSILALRAVPLNQKSLSFNATICDPFNADYDGDAMKIHFVQKLEAIEEAKSRMALTKNIIHARYGKLAIANDQDQVSGLYLLSHTDKRRKGEWNPLTGLGFTEEGIPYVSQKVALEVFSRTYSQDRKTGEKRKILSLPEDSIAAPDGTICYTGRALFSHLFTVLDCEYVSARFTGNTPNVDEEGNITKGKEQILIRNGKLLQGTLEKNAFGAGDGSIGASFIYHEGFEKGQAKLVEFIEMATRLGLMAHRAIGFTMGVQDVKGSKESDEIVDRSYALAADEIEKIQVAYDRNNLVQFAETEDQRVYADQDPVGFMEEKIHAITTKFEESTLRPVENFQGSGNPMQISVRSKARGKATNVQQMGASYGLVMVGGRRIRNGIGPDRVLPHYPKGSSRPEYSGFVRSSYSSGMEPDEYFMTSMGGRRSTVESGMGNISKSGYLERKTIKGIESYVVDKKMRVINSRTRRVVSPIVGEDGLRPFHLRMHESNGHMIELQPFFFDFECKHGKTLADKCDECKGGSDVELFRETVEAEFKGHRVKPSKKSMGRVESMLAISQVTKPNVRKMGKKFSAYYMDSLCPPGEAIGAVAAACIGEPATQAALRTFHFAGKMSFQGSIDRLIQILESPLQAGSKIKAPQSVLRFREKVDLPTAQKIASAIRTVYASRLIKLIEYDLGSDSMIVNLDWDKVRMYNVSLDLILSKVRNRAEDFGANLVTDSLQDGGALVIYTNSGSDPKKHLYLKEAIMSLVVNGLVKDEFEVYVKKPEDDPENMGRFWLDVRYCGNTFLNYCEEMLGDYFDFEVCNTVNIGWIYRKYGLEAALISMVDQIDFQMNGGRISNDAEKAKGIGEYDWRYIRTIADILGEEGILGQLGYNGVAAFSNPSFLAGCSLERSWPQISHASIMGNFDPLRGVAESIVAGKTIQVGNQISNNP